MESKNVWGIIFLTFIILVFSVGGYFFMQYMIKETKPEEKKNFIEEITDLRIDKTKDYIYYENGQEVLKAEEITRDEAIVNFTTLTALNASLREEEQTLYGNIKYIKDVELPELDSEGNKIEYYENEEGIYSLQYRHYENIKFGDYVSLIATDFAYDIVKGSIPFALKSYVIDIKTGKILTEEELLTKYSLTKDTIKEKVKNRLKDTQVLGEDENVIIDIDGTLNDLKYTIYINKTGQLSVSFIVKSNQINYNDVVELN